MAGALSPVTARWSGSGAGSGTTLEGVAVGEFNLTGVARFALTVHAERATLRSSGYPLDFTQSDAQLEAEFGRAWYPFGAGIGYIHEHEYDGSDLFGLHGMGFGVDRWPNFYIPSSYYGSIWYYPRASGLTDEPYSYAIWRFDAGVNLRFTLRSPWSAKLGIKDEQWTARVGDAPTFHLIGPYAAISWWQ